MSGLALVAGPGASGEKVERMLQAAPHRGSQVRVATAGTTWFGVQERPEDDPFLAAGMFASGADRAVVMTGCLYEGSSIVSGDRAAEHVWAAYAGDGTRGLEVLAGSLAAVIIDGGRLVAVRSPVGERSLFWRREGPLTAFSSEEKQLLEPPFSPASLDVEATLDALASTSRDVSRTCFRSVQRVRPGSVLAVADGRVASRNFFEPRRLVATSREHGSDAVARFRELLGRAVRRRLAPRTALLLSGGLDSSSIAAEAAPLSLERFGSPLTVLSARYPDVPGVDESELVRLTAERLGCRVVWTSPRPDPFSELDQRAWLLDSPAAAPLYSNYQAILEAARAHGLTSVLDGHDGDSVLGLRDGAGHALLRRGRLPTFARHVSFIGHRDGLGVPATIRRLIVPALVEFAPGLRTTWRKLRQVDPAGHPPTWVTGGLRRRLIEREGPANWIDREADLVENHLVFALEKLDRMAMATGLSLMHPLADPDLVAFLLGLPPEVKFSRGWTKSLVRQGFPELPVEVRLRKPKMVFDDLARALTSPARALQELDSAPQALPGIDWPAVRSALAAGSVHGFELHFLLVAFAADRFFASRRFHVERASV